MIPHFDPVNQTHSIAKPIVRSRFGLRPSENMTINDIPLRTKLVVFAMLVSGIALLVSAVAGVLAEQWRTERRVIEDINRITAVSARLLTEPIEQRDNATAQSILQGVGADYRVLDVRVRDVSGQVLAAYSRPGVDRSDGVSERIARQTLLSGGRPIGVLEITPRSAADPVWGGPAASVALGMGLCGGAVAYLLAVGLQRPLTRPLLVLRATARQIRSKRDLTLRLPST